MQNSEEFQSFDDVSLHVLEIADRVRVRSHFDVVASARRVDLLVLAGDPQASDARQLVVFFGDILQNRIFSVFNFFSTK